MLTADRCGGPRRTGQLEAKPRLWLFSRAVPVARPPPCRKVSWVGGRWLQLGLPCWACVLSCTARGRGCPPEKAPHCRSCPSLQRRSWGPQEWERQNTGGGLAHSESTRGALATGRSQQGPSGTSEPDRHRPQQCPRTIAWSGPSKQRRNHFGLSLDQSPQVS